MEVLASVFDTIFRPLRDFFARTFGYVISGYEYMCEVDSEFNELKSRREDILKLVEAAELRGMEPTNQVKWWMNGVNEVEDLVEELREEYQVLPNNLINTYRHSRRCDEALSDIRNLKEKSDFPKIAEEPVQVRFEQVPSSLSVIKMDNVLAQLQMLMTDRETGLIGIYGMAGVGKTAVLSKLNNDFLSKRSTKSLIVYIEVTKDYDLSSVQNIIGDRLGIVWDNKTLKERAIMLYNVLIKTNFVLILDDLWERIDLKMIGIPEPEKNSKNKVIIATRMEDVCDRMDVMRKIKIECLSWENSWKLFKEKVGEDFICSNSEIKQLAKEVALKCGGLPLALITVGRAMASKKTIKEWKHSITVLKYAPWQLSGMKDDLLCHLKNSYDNLSNDNLQNCLLYCSLFPEGFSIYKETIIGHCMGEGFIDSSYMEMDEMYNKGHDLLGVLKIASLLERGDDDDHVKMHPMIRAMALWIACDYGQNLNKWLVRAGLGFKEAPDSEKWSEAERVSLMGNNIRELCDMPHCVNLKTLMLQGNPKLEKICGQFFQFMPSLRVLDLSHTSINELPADIRFLVSLRYLDLYSTNVRSLPKEIKSLRNLRLLLLSHMPLEIIPCGVLSSFVKLEVLCMEMSFGDWKLNPFIRPGVDLRELEGLKQLKALDITIQTMSALKKLSMSRWLASCIRNLLIRNCTRLVTMKVPSSDLWRDLTRLERIWLANCVNLEEIIIEGNDIINPQQTYRNFDSVIFKGHNNISSISKDSPFVPNLQRFILQGLHKARIIWKSGCVNNLSSLHILYCAGIEWLIEEKEGVEIENNTVSTIKEFTILPNLKELYLHGLTNFKGFNDGKIRLNFPMLESLKVIECPKFKRLEFDGDKLSEIHCTEQWWEGLEWNEDERDVSRFHFLPLLKFI